MRRGATAANRDSAATAAVALVDEQSAGDGNGASASAAGMQTEASPSRGRRRQGSAAAAGTGHGMPAGISNGKYDLQCFRCLQRPPTHTAFVYVSELMR